MDFENSRTTILAECEYSHEVIKALERARKLKKILPNARNPGFFQGHLENRSGIIIQVVDGCTNLETTIGMEKRGGQKRMCLLAQAECVFPVAGECPVVRFVPVSQTVEV